MMLWTVFVLRRFSRGDVEGFGAASSGQLVSRVENPRPTAADNYRGQLALTPASSQDGFNHQAFTRFHYADARFERERHGNVFSRAGQPDTGDLNSRRV